MHRQIMRAGCCINRWLIPRLSPHLIPFHLNQTIPHHRSRLALNTSLFGFSRFVRRQDLHRVGIHNMYWLDNGTREIQNYIFWDVCFQIVHIVCSILNRKLSHSNTKHDIKVYILRFRKVLSSHTWVGGIPSSHYKMSVDHQIPLCAPPYHGQSLSRNANQSGRTLLVVMLVAKIISIS